MAGGVTAIKEEPVKGRPIGQARFKLPGRSLVGGISAQQEDPAIAGQKGWGRLSGGMAGQGDVTVGMGDRGLYRTTNVVRQSRIGYSAGLGVGLFGGGEGCCGVDITPVYR